MYAGVGNGGDVVVVSAWHVSGIRGSGSVSSANDVVGMSGVREMGEVGGVCEMCMCLCLARGGVGGKGGEWMRGFSFGFTILWEQGECWTFVCGWVAVVWVV